jgi:hypothetical protein
VEHKIVFRQPGKFAAWPANFGMWHWGNEIVFGFTLGNMARNAKGQFHPRDKSRPFVPMQARSTDGGEQWEVIPTPCRTPGNRGFSADDSMDPGLRVEEVLSESDIPTDPPGGINFHHPDFALMCARTTLHKGAKSWFYVSMDRCRTWSGPYWLPSFGLDGVSARTDYVVSNANECLLFLSAAKSDGWEGRPFCAKTMDGGRKFSFVSWIRDEPGKGERAIMPASLRLPDSRLITAIRFGGANNGGIDLYTSTDEARTWQYLSRAVSTGPTDNPPTLTLLQDGRLCITYGYRLKPFGIRAVLSDDLGLSWNREVVLRDDGGCPDLGYPRTAQRSDGKLVTVYYFNDHTDGERYIGATIWSP